MFEPDEQFHEMMQDVFAWEDGFYKLVDESGRVIGQLLLKDDSGVVELDLIHVPKHMRGQSIGINMLRHLTHCADHCQLDLMLCVMPSDPSYIDGLIDWYGAQGFEISEELCSGDDLVMYRPYSEVPELSPS